MAGHISDEVHVSIGRAEVMISLKESGQWDVDLRPIFVVLDSGKDEAIAAWPFDGLSQIRVPRDEWDSKIATTRYVRFSVTRVSLSDIWVMANLDHGVKQGG